MIKLVVSDYLIPVSFSIVLLGLWFGWRDQPMRDLHQRGVLMGSMGLGIANVIVTIVNLLYFRHRPFDSYEVNLLFYMPTDPSFPANPASLTFAIATGVWAANRKIGTGMYVIALLYSFSRVYAGVFYPLDVVAGGMVGIVATSLAYLILKLIEPVPTIALRLVRFLCLA